MRRILSALPLACSILIAACGSGASPQLPEDGVGMFGLPAGACVITFSADVRAGPSTGAHYEGFVTLAADNTGALHDSALYTNDGKVLAVSGSVQGGTTLTMRFDLGGGKSMTGAGALAYDLRQCMGGELKGTLVGPEAADAGDWNANCGQIITVPSGAMFLAAPTSHVIYKKTNAFASATVWAGVLSSPGNTDGPRTSAKLNTPIGLAYDAVHSAFYIGDSGNNRLRRVDQASGSVTTPVTASTISAASTTAGFAPLTTFSSRGIAVDPSGAAFMTDYLNDVLWKMNGSTFAVKLFAGKPATPGRADGTGTAARFNGPTNAQMSPDGTVVNINDYGNCVVRQVTVSGAQVVTLGTVTGSCP